MSGRLRFNPFAVEQQPTKADVLEGSQRKKTMLDELEHGPPKTTTIICPGYGGITVYNADTPTEALLRVLDQLVKHQRMVDDTLIAYDVLLAKLASQPVQGFCIRRAEDGWTLAVPSATKREEALLQITQALLELARGPFGATLRAERITPYRE
jgi:hypothetical protein